MPFKVRDLMINVLPEARGGDAKLPSDDGPIPTPLTPFTPIIQVAAMQPVFERFAKSIPEVLKEGNADINPNFVRLLDTISKEVGNATIGGVFAGGMGMPDPNCDGTSMETIPTPITPIVHNARTVLRPEHLGALKQRLSATLQAIEETEALLQPRTPEDVEVLTVHLESALTELRSIQ